MSKKNLKLKNLFIIITRDSFVSHINTRKRLIEGIEGDYEGSVAEHIYSLKRFRNTGKSSETN